MSDLNTENRDKKGVVNKNYYKVHRLLMPDGTQFLLDEKRDTAETAGGVENNSGLSPTDNVSKISISDSNEKIKQKDKNFTPKPVDQHLANWNFYLGKSEEVISKKPVHLRERDFWYGCS